MIAGLKKVAHKRLSQWLYRHPEPQLQSERLYLYLGTLYSTRHVLGEAIEVGCFQGATAAYASRFLKRIDCSRRYLCVDTFSGFPQDQFAEDVKLGTTAALDHECSLELSFVCTKIARQMGGCFRRA